MQVGSEGFWEGVESVQPGSMCVTFESFPLGMGFCAADEETARGAVVRPS